MNRWRKLPWWLAGIYLSWSLFVYFGSMGGEGHSWWPIMLYPVIWPWSLLYELAQAYACDLLTPQPATASSATWIIVDRVAGAFYIVIGTLWLWVVGKLISMGVTRLFGTTIIEPNHTPDGIRQPADGLTKPSV